MGKRIVINTFGSFGDVHPYMALALELQSRGHEPVVATMEFYREKVLGAGLHFAPVRPDIPGPSDQDLEFVNRIMEPRTGPRFLMDEVIFPAVRDSYEDLVAASAGADLLITHPAAPAGPLVGHKTGLPWVSTVLAPFSFFSAYDPPVPPYWSWGVKLRVLGPGVMGFLMRLMRFGWEAEKVSELRDELSIADYGNPIFEGQHSPTLVLALFSKIFGPPQPDWPKQTRVTGFCFYDEAHEQTMTSELVDFLEGGAAPIVFTLGTSAVWVAQDFFKQSIEAARRLRRRAVLVIGDPRNLPDEVPDNMIAVNYAPYQMLLPRTCAVVHHGGVGTTAQGLRAGSPTLIVPFAFDQFDNADHARRLGTSRTLYRKNYTAANVAKELDVLLTHDRYAEQAKEVSLLVKQENGAARAADLIEQLFNGKRPHNQELAHAFGD